MVRVWATFLGLAWRADPLRTVVVLVLAPLSGLTAAGVAVGAKWLVDGVLTGAAATTAAGVAVLVAAAVGMPLLGAAAARVRLSLQHRVGHELDLRLMRLCTTPPDLRHHEDPEFADRLETLAANRATITLGLTSLVENLTNVVRLGSVTALLATIHPVLLLLPPFAVPALLAAAAGRRGHERADEDTARPTRLREWLFTLGTTAPAAREVRIGGLAEELTGRHDRLQDAVHRTRLAATARSAVLDLLGWAVFCAGFLGALALVLTWVASGSGTPGDVVLLVVAAAQVDSALAIVVLAAHWLRKARWAGSHLVWLTNRVGTPAPTPAPGAPAPARGDLVLDRVSYTYPGSVTPVVDEVSMRLSPDTTVALVGANGAGKSTLVKLLCGLYQPDGGRITAGGVDLRELTPQVWHRDVSATFQEFCRFELPVRESVGLGDLTREPTDAAVTEALRRAGAERVLSALPDGLDTQLGRSFSEGVDLSTGQWQALAVARAMLPERPALLVLDEPAASLDPGAEHALFRAYAEIGRARRGTVTVLVSHRFATVRDADLIVVLDGGRVAEQGSHDELMAAGGVYARMFDRHRAGYRLTGAQPPTPR
jgi:ATP-binding cassette subfamily B protein